MGCSASIQQDNSPALPTANRTEDDKTLLSISQTPVSNDSDSPHPKTCKGSELYSIFHHNEIFKTPLPLTKPLSLNTTPNGQETLMISAINDGVSTPEESIIEKGENSPKVSLIALSRRFSHEGAEKTMATLTKPSTFLREKLSFGDVSIPSHSGLLSPKVEAMRRKSLGVGQGIPFVGVHSNLVKKDRKIKKPMTVKEEEQTKNLMPRKNPKTFLAHLENKDHLESLSPSVYSPRFNKGHRIVKSQGNMTPIVVEGVVKEECEAEEGENEENQGEALKELKKEKLKKQIQEKFRVNLVNLLQPRKKSSKPNGFKSLNVSRIPEEVGLEQNTLSDNARKIDYKEDEIIIKPDTPTLTENAQSQNISNIGSANLKIPNFDLSIDESLEDSHDQKSVIPYTPIKKSLFSSGFEDITDASPMGFAARRRRMTLVHNFPKDLGFPKENRTSMPSIVIEAKVFKRSESSVSSVRETRILDKSTDVDGQKRINQYIVGHELGRGSFGKVKLGIDSETGMKYAIKIADKGKLKKKLLAKDKSLYSQLQTEIAVMKKLNHPNIVQLFEVIDDPNADKLYLVMDFIERGAIMSKQYWRSTEQTNAARLLIRASTEAPSNLKSLLSPAGRRFSALRNDEETENENKYLSEEKARKYFRDLILGLDYMHNYANVIHRDIKPENLLIDDNDTLKISDFNISCILEDIEGDKGLVKSAAGTKAFLAPEAWAGSKVRGHPVDIWAAGATLYYFLYGKPPFKCVNAHQLKEMILNAEPEFPEEISIDKKAIDLIKACLVKNPEERVTLEKIMVDEWLTEDGKEPLTNEGFEQLAVTDADFDQAFKDLKMNIVNAFKMKSQLGSARKSFLSRKTLDFSALSSFREKFEVSEDIIEGAE